MTRLRLLDALDNLSILLIGLGIGFGISTIVLAIIGGELAEAVALISVGLALMCIGAGGMLSMMIRQELLMEQLRTNVEN